MCRIVARQLNIGIKVALVPNYDYKSNKHLKKVLFSHEWIQYSILRLAVGVGAGEGGFLPSGALLPGFPGGIEYYPGAY